MLVWGFNFVAVKLLLLEMSASAATLIRWGIMSICLVGVCLATKTSLRYPPGLFWRINLQGFVAMGLYMVCFVGGMATSTAAEGAIILGCSPVLTLLLAAIAGQEPFKWTTLRPTLVAFVGVALVVSFSPSTGTGTHSSLFGHVLLLVSAVLWALSAVLSRPLVHKVEPLRMLVLSMPGGLVALLPFGWHDVSRFDWAHFSPLGWAMLFYMAVVAGAVGFVLFYLGVKQVGAPGAMLYQYLVSPIATLSSIVVLHVGLHPIQLVGLVVVLTGVTLANIARQNIQPVTQAVE